MKTAAFSHQYESHVTTGTKTPRVVSRRNMLRNALARDSAPRQVRPAAVTPERSPAFNNRTGSLEKLYGKSAPERLARMQEELSEKGGR